MSSTSGTDNDDIFISVISDIKTYKGTDPILPWLRGIKKMKDSLSPNILKEKLPRFLQKCAQTFESDRRYANDLRYLRVWLQLMDFVDDPKALLCTMEEKHIGIKRSLFYQAYALYYEKLKKFEKADMMYHQGVQNFADPLDDLKKSYEQFLQRMEHKKKKIQNDQRHQKMAGKSILRVKSVPTKFDDTRRKNDKTCETHYKLSGAKDQVPKETVQHAMPVKESKTNSSLNKIARGDSGHLNQKSKDKCNKFRGDDTVYRFVDTAIVRSEEDNACHHGLVEPTINTKEALNAINSMFREPLDPTLVNKRSNRNQPKPIVNPKVDQKFEIFIDENVNDNRLSDQKGEKGFEQKQQEPFQIYVDGEDDDVEKRGSEDNLERSSAFVFLNPNDIPENSADDNIEMSSRARLGEDTVVVRRFVGKAISDEPKVENVFHHGLVEPTINWKEAMNDINSMFGKPIDFVRTTRRKRLENNLKSNNQSNGFVILPDVELDHRKDGNLKPRSTAKIGSDLFEPTVCTKEALDDINQFFAMPLDF